MSSGFGKEAGPGVPKSEQISFGNSPLLLSPQPSTSPSVYFSGAQRFPSPRTFEAVRRSPSHVATPHLAPGSSQPFAATNRYSSLQWGERQSSMNGGFVDRSPRNSFPNYPGASNASKVVPSVDSESSRRPPVQYNDDFLNEPINNTTEGNADATFNHHVATQRRQLPFSAAAINHSIINPVDPLNKAQRPSVSPPKTSTRYDSASDSQYSQRMSSSAHGMNGDASMPRLPSHSLTKRTRSPPAATGQMFIRNSPLTCDDTEREEQAKSKRLARFRTELDEVEPSVVVQHGPNITQNKKVSLVKSLENRNSMEDLSKDYDNEDLPSSSIIMGLCSDMCPESERGERERKGDLDRYERLDGDRNHTNKILAVKKYNRTAEREAELIRPLPILQKTMDYLLGLLDQPYDDRLLGLYNFLWDRMRAIRMDLRMQHIFNVKAITMLEQMIRLHVIAMHELCEFSKGEGFSEGFDAHLNIEQMNKTSVELFQLYDDHRKKGIIIPTEKEFRGYYALLKLDKHPGYKVEAAELSLDLAKMTAEMRQTQEILFARDVARSCRTGNFIAFFRHAKKASYLQACLMHAHFSKLRTQALASLHSGLQFGQGLPVIHAANWLGMEGEDIRSLLEYHGFLIKEFEEPYMVKEGSFLHDDKDYPTRCSILVHGKKSDTIVEDISSSHEITLPSEAKQLEKSSKHKHVPYQPVETESPLSVSIDGDMETETVSSPRGSIHIPPVLDRSSGTQTGVVPGSRIGQPFIDDQRVSVGSSRSNNWVPKAFASLRSHSMQERPSPLTPKSSSFILGDGQLNDKISPSSSADQVVVAPSTSSLGSAKQDEFEGPLSSSPNTILQSEYNATPQPLMSANLRKLIPSEAEVTFADVTSPTDGVFMEELHVEQFTAVQRKVEDDYMGSSFDKEVAEAKLRLLLRLWRRRFVRKKQLHEENRLAANAALSSLSLGPPLLQNKDKPVHLPSLNIDKAVHERYEKWLETRVRWNVSDVVAAKLAEKNVNSNCVCWKVIFFSWVHHGTSDIEARSSITHISMDEWLRYKLIPSMKDETTEGLAISAPGLSVWRKWAPNNSGDTACYFSVIKDTTSVNSEMKQVGTSAMLFPISKTIAWDVQRTHLHNLTMALPIEACIPLLIIIGSRQGDVADISTDIVAKLGLEDIDKSRVGTYAIICLNEREDTGQFRRYFSDQKLKDGLIWLASESRPQPILSCMTTRELVSLHLNSCLDALHRLYSDKVGPNQCISAFNEAMNKTVEIIVTAAKGNPTGWPCPELFLLDTSSSEFSVVRQFLPNLGWSSSEEIEPLISALENCKLPYFSDDLSLLGKGCNIEEAIEEQRQFLQEYLVKYLSQTSKLMHWMMAAKEVTLMLQNYTRLVLCNTEFKLVPSWILIFRRVFNWQLYSAESFTKKAYVLEQSDFTCNPQFLKSDMDVHMPHFSAYPLLDEMVQVSCSPIVSKRVRSSPIGSRNVVARTSGENTAAFTLPSCVFEENDNYSEFRIQPKDDSDMHLAKSNLDWVTKDDKEDDRLIQLLHRCNIVQDEIGKKLSIYF